MGGNIEPSGREPGNASPNLGPHRDPAPRLALPVHIQPDEEIHRALESEFPPGATEPPDVLSRRSFLTLMGASFALFGSGGCQPPREEIVPYVRAPEEIVPGKPLYFATAMTIGGVAKGLLVEQHMGRPTKVEGNPDHPASLGATDAYAQAAVLSLYDPDRSSVVIHEGQASSWPQFAPVLRDALQQQRSRKGAGLRVLTEGVTSPSLTYLLEQLLAEYPEARWLQYEPVDLDSAHEGASLAFGRAFDVVYHIENADTILSLDGDFIAAGPGNLRYAREFASRRRIRAGSPRGATMNRLYALGPAPTLTMAAADHRLVVRAAEVESVARMLATRLGVAAAPNSTGPCPEAFLAALAGDLTTNAGRCLVLTGARQPAAVHALVHAMNSALGNVNRTVSYIPPLHGRPSAAMSSLRELVEEMKAGAVEAIFMLGTNPVYTAPSDLQFGQHLAKVPFRVHLGPYRDETALLCQWHIPEAHFLESWGDARAYDGTVSLIQPLIAPLYNGISALEFVAECKIQAPSTGHDLVRACWQSRWQERDADFDHRWKSCLRAGIIPGSKSEPQKVTLRNDWIMNAVQHQPAAGLELAFQPDPTAYDGRFANNAWLQELPRPISQLTWDNVAVLGPETANQLGLKMEIGNHGGDLVTDMIEIRYRDTVIEAPSFIMPGHAEQSVTVYLGYGRTAAGQVGSGVGYNAYVLRISDHPWYAVGVELRRLDRRYRLASTQLHHVMHGRGLVRTGTLDEYKAAPDFVVKGDRVGDKPQFSLPLVDESPTRPEHAGGPPSLFPGWPSPRYKWGMVIDLGACTGCGACVVACQAENNIPVVGKAEVARGREMHWLRIDSYQGSTEASQTGAVYFQPVPCMHCEKAPCEVVCPVVATSHSEEGLNQMTYNRCVGTRYCSNNCPYKVRRFNHYEYADWTTESLKLLRNPDVTVRSRGIMEKCTYCVQRINAARIHVEKDDRPLVQNRAGEWIKPIYENELLTACQAVCPAEAIVFGDLNDPRSRVSQLRYEQPLHYSLLAELGTQPRTTYLAALRNPNPSLSKG